MSTYLTFPGTVDHMCPVTSTISRTINPLEGVTGGGGGGKGIFIIFSTIKIKFFFKKGGGGRKTSSQFCHLT